MCPELAEKNLCRNKVYYTSLRLLKKIELRNLRCLAMYLYM